MQVDPALQRRLLDLAEIDAERIRIEHQRNNLSELAEVDEAEKALRASQDAHVSARTALSDLDREAERQEREVDSVRARADKDRTLMDSGSVSAKQLADIEHELESVKRRQSALEDDLLELMERRDATAEEEQRAAADVQAREETLADATRRRDEALAELNSNMEGKDSERAALLEEFPADLIAAYDRVREAKGAGAGMLRAGRCGACQLEFDRASLAEIKNTAEDEVVTCDNCGAILVRTAESGL